MKYLVRMEVKEGGPPVSSKEGIERLETLAFPSFEALKKLEADRKIVGGASVGQRVVVFIANASDHAELDKLVKSVPFWGITRVEVTALDGFDERLATDKGLVERLKQAG